MLPPNVDSDQAVGFADVEVANGLICDGYTLPPTVRAADEVELSTKVLLWQVNKLVPPMAVNCDVGGVIDAPV